MGAGAWVGVHGCACRHACMGGRRKCPLRGCRGWGWGWSLGGWLRSRTCGGRMLTVFRRDIQDYIQAKYVEARWVADEDRELLGL